MDSDSTPAQQAPAVVDPFDARPFWEGYEYKRWVVTIEAGPYKRKKPAFRTVMIIRAKTGAEAKETASRQLLQKVKRPTFAARLAHPIRDLGLTPRESFTPTDHTAALSDQQRSSWGVWCITCKCCHKADVEEFTRSPSGVELGKARYQCRKCFRAWQVATLAPAWVAENGYHVPAQLGCVAVMPVV